MDNRNVKWHQMTAQAVQDHLHTNASCGLSRKEARSRYRKQGANTLFDARKPSAGQGIRTFLTDPAILLAVFVCLLSICFSELGSGISAAVLLVGALAFAGRLLYLEKQLLAEINTYRIPAVTVIRSRRASIISAREVVAGDVLFLRKGDIVPADCRLIDARELRVLTLCPEDGKLRFRDFLKDPETVCEPNGLPLAFSCENMLFGGSEICEGSARAIVVSVGVDTCLGSLKDLEIPAEYGGADTEDDTVSGVRPLIRLYGFVLFSLLIPLTVVAMLLLGQTMSALSLFLALSAWLASSAQSFLIFYFRLPVLFTRLRSMPKDVQSECAVFKTARAVTKMSMLTDLIVLGHSGTSDGRLHLYRCAVGDSELQLREHTVNESLQPLCEAFLLRRHADMADPIYLREEDRFLYARRELLDGSGFDADALSTRLTEVSVLGRRGEELLLEVKIKGGEFRLLFSNDAKLIDRCTFYEKDRRTAVFSPRERENLRLFRAACVAEGARTLSVIKQVGTQMIFLGIVALREQLQRDNMSIVNALQSAGVRVSFFLSGSYEEECCYAKALGLQEPLIPPSDVDLHRLMHHQSVYFGVEDSSLRNLIQELRRQKRRVAVLGAEFEDLSVMHLSALAIAADPSLFDFRDGTDPTEKMTDPAGIEPTVRRHADVLMPRTESLCGALSSFLQALHSCRATEYRMLCILRFLLLSQFARAVFVILSCFFGVGSMSGMHLLYGGVICESVIVLWISLMPVPKKYRQAPLPLTSERTLFLLSDMRTWLPAVSTSVLVLLVSFVLHLCGLLSREGYVTLLFCSMILIEILSFCRVVRPCLTKQTAKPFCLVLLSMLLPVACVGVLCAAFPPIDKIFFIGTYGLPTLVFLLALPVTNWLVFRLISSFFGRTAK